jgi:integrase
MATQAIPQADPGTPHNVVKHGARLTRSKMVHLTPEELLAMLKTARARGARDWAMILLAYRHGLRASEVCDLKMADVDLKAGSLSIWRLKGSLHTVQPLYRHKGQPLLDEIAALRSSGYGRATQTARTIYSCSRKVEGFTARSSSASCRRVLSRLAWHRRSAIHTR